METNFENVAQALHQKANHIISGYLKARESKNSEIHIPADFRADFFVLVDRVSLRLMEDNDNFYGYFLFQMAREIRFDISSPTAVNFKGAKYVIYFNPVIFLTLDINQMETTIKHEILHILSMHLLRAKKFKAGYGKLAANIAMDIVVNSYLTNLPPYATTLEWVNLNHSLNLLPFAPFEYYIEKVQQALNLLEADKNGAEDDSAKGDAVKTAYDPESTHDMWEASSNVDEKTIRDFTAKLVNNAKRRPLPDFLENLLSSLKNSDAELPWSLYLKRLMGTIESNKKNTIMRRSRRQPDRLDLRGQLRSHKAKIAVALDISGSIGDEEFNQAMKEVLDIVRNYNHEITVIECDSEIRRVYKVKSLKDIKGRSAKTGGTRFTPVFEYVNVNKFNLLIYFTDGKGEHKLQSTPRGYKTLWVISGQGNNLSLKEAYGAVRKLNAIEAKVTTLDISDASFRDGYSMNDQEKCHI